METRDGLCVCKAGGGGGGGVGEGGGQNHQQLAASPLMDMELLMWSQSMVPTDSVYNNVVTANGPT